MRAWIAVALAAALLAGCTESADPQQDDDVVPESTDGTTPPATDTTVAPEPTDDGDPGEDPDDESPDESPNTPPEATLSADSTSGEAPLEVTFTVSVSDADGDALNWTLDLGDGTTAEGTTDEEVTHSYAAGEFTAILTVSDGEAEATATAQVTATAAAPEPEEDLHCHIEDGYEDVGGVYVMDAGWVFLESNDIPGLQVENNHPVGEPFWYNADWDGCPDGDMMLF